MIFEKIGNYPHKWDTLESKLNLLTTKYFLHLPGWQEKL